MLQRFNFVQEEVFPHEEGDFIEFKEISSKNPVNAISNHAEQYVLGFINAQSAGDLYFGIDDSGVIKGITLTKSNKDEISRNIPNKLRSTDPFVPHDYYQVHIHNVLNPACNRIEDLYIIQIHIIETKERILYRTAGGSVYFKKGSSCIKLSSEEITKEIERRTQISLKKEADDLDRKLEQDPDNRRILDARAKNAKHMGDIETMESIYNRILALDPKSPQVRMKYSDARRSIGDLSGALSILNEAIQLNISDSSILKSKGDMLLSLTKWNEALQAYEEASKLNPEDYTIITQIGVALRQLRRYAESIDCFNCALSKAPNYRLAKYEKKKAYHELFKRGIKISK